MAQLPAYAVLGDGWAALGAVGFLLQKGEQVLWIAGSGGRLVAPLPSLEAGLGAQAWRALAEKLELTPGEVAVGSFLREFRNKAFREPAWIKAPDLPNRREVRDEMLWGPEASFVPVNEARFDLSLAELEVQIRQRLLQHPMVRRIEDLPVTEIRLGKISGPIELVMGSGEIVQAQKLIYADRWTHLGQISGLPKPIPFVRNREPAGVLQASFWHSDPVGLGTVEGFLGACHKDAGEEFQRSVFGYFFENGSRSIWTLVIAAEEVEDNHEIAKKLRKLKQTLDRMFAGASWLPQGKTEFMSTVRAEQVRFEEFALFGAGEAPDQPFELPKAPGVWFLTDGYGPASAFEQVARLVERELGVEWTASQQEPELSAPVVAARFD